VLGKSSFGGFRIHVHNPEKLAREGHVKILPEKPNSDFNQKLRQSPILAFLKERPQQTTNGFLFVRRLAVL
jgi:hypothetical protein